jgi:sugar lactone lactonase YvrE
VTLQARLAPTAKRGLYAATVRFPREGSWTVSVSTGGRRTRLGAVRVDVARDPLLRDPITLAAAADGSLVVGQLREGPLIRLQGGRATTLAEGLGVFHVYVAGGATYVAARDGVVYRLDGSSFTRVSPALDASAVAVDAAGNLYVTVYVGWIKKVAPDGTVTTIAGDGTEGYAGDGGPASGAKIFHPHSIALGADGALYVADTENRRIRRIDLASGRITTFGGDVGITVSVAAGPDGSIYSADVVRDGLGGGVTRTTPDGVTRRILSLRTANGVAVAADGTVYVNAWEDKRVLRLDQSTGRTATVARG